MTVGTEIQVRLFDSMNAAPASQLAIAGWLHGEQAGYGTGEMNMDPMYKAFVAYLPEGHEMVPVGVMTWDKPHYANMLWIYQAFVVEEHRGKGIFRAMLDEAVAKAIEMKLATIQLGTSMRHKAALDVYRKTGFTQERVLLSLEVPQI